MLALKSHMLASSSANLHLMAHTHLILNLSVSVRQAQVLFLPELLLPSLAGTQQLSWPPAMNVAAPLLDNNSMTIVCIGQHESSALKCAFQMF